MHEDGAIERLGTLSFVAGGQWRGASRAPRLWRMAPKMPDLARRHQLHGLQPVLPVHDVAATARWLVRLLGFEVDFLWGEPPTHGRVKLGRPGRGGWGQPVWIHLGLTRQPVHPCGEMRIHVGHDIDGLHAHCVAEGAAVLEPLVNQPWGLREFVIAMPEGHRLRLCAEAQASS